MIEQRDRFDVVTVGEVLLDFIAPEAESLVTARDFIPAPGGAPANVAVAVARLEGAAAFVGAVGDDPFGSSLVALLRDYAVDTSSIHTVPQRTTLAFVTRKGEGIPDFLFYRGADAELQPQDIPVELIARSTFLYLSSMALMTEPSRSATLYALEVARESDVLVAVDPNLRPASWPSLDAARGAIMPLVRGADVLKLNEEEARILANTSDLDAAIEVLGAVATLLVVTLGSAGCRWRVPGGYGELGAPAVTVRDVTGAGDAFMGALLTELSRQGYTGAHLAPLDVAAVESALRFATAAGAFACTAPGAIPSLPSRDDVEGLLR